MLVNWYPMTPSIWQFFSTCILQSYIFQVRHMVNCIIVIILIFRHFKLLCDKEHNNNTKYFLFDMSLHKLRTSKSFLPLWCLFFPRNSFRKIDDTKKLFFNVVCNHVILDYHSHFQVPRTIWMSSISLFAIWRIKR